MALYTVIPAESLQLAYGYIAEFNIGGRISVSKLQLVVSGANIPGKTLKFMAFGADGNHHDYGKIRITS